MNGSAQAGPHAHRRSNAPAAPAAALDPTGTGRLLKDQNGNMPSSGAVVEISFANGGFTLKAQQLDETVTDSGTYTVQGRRITLEFKELDKGRQSPAFSRLSDTLVLLFQRLGEGAGWSM